MTSRTVPSSRVSSRALEGFIDRQKQSFEQYLADQYDIASNARLETLEDGTVLLVMCQDQDAVFDAIRDTILAAAEQNGRVCTPALTYSPRLQLL